MVFKSSNAGTTARVPGSARLPALFVALLLAASVLLAGPAAVAQAHETRTAGPWRIQAGWLYEPAWSGELNAIEIIVNDARTGQPVDGLQDGMTVEARVGPVSRSLEIRPAPLRPGHYLADVIPTRPGDVTITLTITQGSDAIREAFTSGPNRFEPVTARSTIELPPAETSGAGGGLPAWLPGTVLGGLALAGVAVLLVRSRRP